MNQEKKQMNCKPAFIRYRGSISGKRGFSLLELIIAIFILSVGITSALGLIVSTIRTSMDTRNAVIASGLAQEGVELVRNIRDNNMLYVLDNLSRDREITFKCHFPDLTNSYCAFDYLHVYNPSVCTKTCSADPASFETRLYLNGGGGFQHTNVSGAKDTPFRRYIYFVYDDTAGVDSTNPAPVGVWVYSRVWWDGSATAPGDCTIANRCIEATDYLPKRD